MCRQTELSSRPTAALNICRAPLPSEKCVPWPKVRLSCGRNTQLNRLAKAEPMRPPPRRGRPPTVPVTLSWHVVFALTANGTIVTLHGNFRQCKVGETTGIEISREEAHEATKHVVAVRRCVRALDQRYRLRQRAAAQSSNDNGNTGAGCNALSPSSRARRRADAASAACDRYASAGAGGDRDPGDDQR